MTGALEIDVTVSCPAWIEAVPGVEDVCRDAARAACAANGATPAAASGTFAAHRSEPGAGRRRSSCAPSTGITGTWTRRRTCSPLPIPTTAGGTEARWRPRARHASWAMWSSPTRPPPPRRRPRPRAWPITYATLVVHGMLHLLGYDHQTAAEADRMEQAGSPGAVPPGRRQSLRGPRRTMTAAR